MNWREFESTWEKFASINNTTFTKIEKPYFYGVKVNYKIMFSDNSGSSQYNPTIFKSTSGFNQYSLKLYTDLHIESQMNQQVVNRKSKLYELLKNLFSRNANTTLEQDLLKKVNAKKLTITSKLLTIEFDHIPNTLGELEFIEANRTKFISKISTPFY